MTRGTLPLERMPAASATITRSILQDAQLTIGLDESLDRVPGVFVNNRYNFSLGARISIRGFGARAAFGVRGIRVIADGIPLTMPDGQSNLNNLDLGAAERVEVLRGPSSALYGNAAGGVISVTTEAPPPAPFGLEARWTGGDAGREGDFGRLSRIQAKLGGSTARADWLLSVSRLETDGFRDYSRAEQTLVNAKGRIALDAASTLGVVVSVVDAPVAESPGALPIDSARLRPRIAWPNNARTLSGEATSQAQAGLTYSRIMGSGRLDVAGWGLGRDVDNALPFAYIFLERRGGGVRASWSGAPGGSSTLSFTAGMDAEYARDDRREFNNDNGQAGTSIQRDQVERVRALGPFAQANIRLSSALELTAGARYDAVRFETEDRFLGDGRDDAGQRTLSAVSPMIGLTWQAGPETRLYANVATAFQTPTTTELINAPPPPGQPCCPGGFNAALDPQKARSAEVGARGRIAQRIEYDVAIYHMNVDNTIVPFQVEGVDGREFFRNAGETRHRGVELSATTRFGRHSVQAAYTFNDFVFLDDGNAETDFEDNRLPGVPRHNLFAGLRVGLLETLRLDLETQYIGEQATEDSNDPAFENQSATVLDVRLLYRASIGGWAASPFIALNNVTDERYNGSVVVNAVGRRYFEPAPGRNLYLGLSLGSPGWAGR